MRGLRAAMSLLTRAPAGMPAPGASDLARAVPWFPVVGGLVGLVVAGSYAGLIVVLPPVAAAGLALAVGLLLTGALHEDGLADTADAMGAGDPEEARRILKDPAHGTFGVLAIVLSVVLRVAALATLDAWTAVAILAGAGALSRGAAASLLAVARPASDAGLGASYATATSRKDAGVAIAVALGIGAISLGVMVVPAALLSALASAGVGVLAARRIGGVTGDVLGAAQQVAEILVLLLGTAAVVAGWPSPAWWR